MFIYKSAVKNVTLLCRKEREIPGAIKHEIIYQIHGQPEMYNDGKRGTEKFRVTLCIC
jgi:hypothetical protein